MPSADGKEVGQYLRPAVSTPQPALTPCSASPVGKLGTRSRGMPPCVMWAIFSSRVASESLRRPTAQLSTLWAEPREKAGRRRKAHRFLMRSSVGTLALQKAPIVALQPGAFGFGCPWAVDFSASSRYSEPASAAADAAESAQRSSASSIAMRSSASSQSRHRGAAHHCSPRRSQVPFSLIHENNTSLMVSTTTPSPPSRSSALDRTTARLGSPSSSSEPAKRNQRALSP